MIKFILSTKGKKKSEVPEEQIHFLKDVENITLEGMEETKDEFVSKLHEGIRRLKNPGIGRRVYATEKNVTGADSLKLRMMQSS